MHLNYFGPLKDVIGNKAFEIWGLVVHFCIFYHVQNIMVINKTNDHVSDANKLLFV